MQYSSGYTVRFDAGHRYTVTVTWTREGFPETDLEAFTLGKTRVDALTRELANRDLIKMLGSYHPSCYGIASFFMDRLAINMPVQRVEVHESDSDIRATVEASAEF